MASRQTTARLAFWNKVRKDIFLFAELCNFKPTWQQAQLFHAVMRGDRKIAIKSGQGPGKTISSVILGLFLALRNENAKVLVVAPTMTQAREVWLATAKKLIKKSPSRCLRSFFNFSEMGVGIDGNHQKEWGVLLRGAGGTTEGSQGQHDENMHIIFEEASGISREITEQYEGTASNPGAIFLRIGNPNSRNCPFFDCFNKDRQKWSCFTWNAEDTPASAWFDPQRNDDLKEKYGEDSDVYRVRVRGEFPHTEPDCLLSFEDLKQCMVPSHLIPMSSKLDEEGVLPLRFGIDFARFGGDENTIFQRQGFAIVEWEFYPHTDPNIVVDHAFRMQEEYLWTNEETLYVPDAGGIGQGLMHNFHSVNKQVFEFQNHRRALNSKDYDNMITEAWVKFADMVKEGGVYIPEDSRLIEQLTSRRYYMTKKSKMCIESKDEYKKRGFDSPDRAEACILAFYPHACPTSQIAVGSRRSA